MGQWKNGALGTSSFLHKAGTKHEKGIVSLLGLCFVKWQANQQISKSAN
jgi:hypothetical protein